MSSRSKRGEADEEIIRRAIDVLQSRLKDPQPFPTSHTVKTYLRLQTQGLDHEVFAVLYLDPLHRLLAYERAFRGTLTHASVYPREVARRALALNADAVVLHHNHTSGSCTPSNADVTLTRQLQRALDLVGVRVLDHVITSDAGAVSMAECGLVTVR